MTASGRSQQTDVVMVSRAEWQQRWVASESWWRFWASDMLADLIDREVVARIRAASHDLAGACRWSVAVGPTHQELERLRLTPTWVARCRHRSCGRTRTVYSAEEWRAEWRCDDHRGAG